MTMNNSFEEYKDVAVAVALMALLVVVMLMVSGCKSTTDKMADSASEKNLGMDGYLLLGELEVSGNSTMPEGKIIMGRVSYKSRKVAIPGDMKTPNTGNFKATKSVSLFGASDYIIEYDWTAGTDADAEKAEARCLALKEKAIKAFEEDEKKDEPVAGVDYVNEDLQ